MPKGIPRNGINKGWYRKGQHPHPGTEFKKGSSESNCINWKGDSVGYHGLHKWIAKKRGKPSFCEQCGTHIAKRYFWANKSHQYKREVTDWIRLCGRCHRIYDKNTKLTREDVEQIKKLRSRGLTQKEIAVMYSVARTTIEMIDIGRSWT